MTMETVGARADEAHGWPLLPLAAWRDTYATLHMQMQIIGKIRLKLSPKMNQWWHVPFYLSARGLTTSPMLYGDRTLEIEFDFVDHNLVIRTSDGATRALALIPRTVSSFYDEVFQILHGLGIDVQIHATPDEVPNPIPFAQDTIHRSYDAESVHRFWEILRRVDVTFKTFRARFRGKSSPVHFFWGSFDLAVSRFCGRRAPPRTDADGITRMAYDEEVISVGFWPGSGPIDGPAFYSYTAPEPAGLSLERVRPNSSFYNSDLREFILMYDDVRLSSHPEDVILEFAQSTYEAGARLAKWDRGALELAPAPRDTGARASVSRY